ncbi:MAG: ABC transporter ATP-binding protein [Acidobacteria bacterium]|nr:ABC transporter ATP-binding protein [Acidobacteriota bacterium]MSO63070.1 ABC transporter ATP-binding protein [Acidobacteriota bacterium]
MDRRAFAYLVPYWRRLILVLVISLVSTAATLAMPYLSKDLIDNALIGRDADALRRIVLMFAVLGVAGFVLNVVSGLRYTRVSAEILFDMRLSMYEHLQRLSPRFYARTRLGDIVSRLNNDISEIQRVAAEVALAWVGNVLFLAGSLVMMVWLDWRLSLVALAPLPISLIALGVYRRRLEGRIADLRQRSSDIGSFLIETLQATSLVVASNAQPRERARFRELNGAFIDALMRMQRVTYFAGGLPGTVLSIGSAVAFFYGGLRVIEGTLTLGTMGAFLAYQMRVFAPAQALMGLYASLTTAKVSWARVREILDAPIDVQERAEARALPACLGEVAFELVTLGTDRQASVLEVVTFSARPGECVALVGGSGVGKSTIAYLVTRLLDPDSGVVRLDGHDLRDLRLADIRRHVVLVEQEPTLFHASVGDNIRYVRPGASDAEVKGAAEASGIARFIEALPNGFATLVGERGLALSAGERQRIALARAFLADPAVLVLDEPTAALDAIAQRQVIDGYQAVMKGRTTLLITHRRELAMAADRVIVLEGSRIVDQGHPRELADRPGVFARLFEIERPAGVDA